MVDMVNFTELGSSEVNITLADIEVNNCFSIYHTN